MIHPQYFHPIVKSTTDGSTTLVHPVLDELYHSRHGAWTESQHIFIRYGLMPYVNKELDSISIFEMGFGSGLNATLVREAADNYKTTIHYVAVELYPVEISVITEMVMPEQLSEERERWLELHRAGWGESVQIDSCFTLQKLKASFPNDLIPGLGSYDLVFYDAFAPGAQPELWGVESLGRCYNLLKPGGVWISYCSKGSVKRNLREVGFEVKVLPGPPGKREITKAVK